MSGLKRQSGRGSYTHVVYFGMVVLEVDEQFGGP